VSTVETDGCKPTFEPLIHIHRSNDNTATLQSYEHYFWCEQKEHLEVNLVPPGGGASLSTVEYSVGDHLSATSLVSDAPSSTTTKDIPDDDFWDQYVNGNVLSNQHCGKCSLHALLLRLLETVPVGKRRKLSQLLKLNYSHLLHAGGLPRSVTLTSGSGPALRTAKTMDATSHSAISLLLMQWQKEHGQGQMKLAGL